MGEGRRGESKASHPKRLILTEIYILLAKEVAPSIINRPIIPAGVAVAAPPTIDPDAIDEETRMKEAAMKAKAGMEAGEAGTEAWADEAGTEARVEADEAGAEAWVETAGKAGVEAPEAAPVKSAAEPAAMKAAAVNYNGRCRHR